MNWHGINFDLEYYKYAVKDLFDRLDEWEFDGIFGTDLVAIECMNEVIRRHKKVPKDVKCVAYDGTYITQIVEPSVTSIVQPTKELAQEAARLICELVNGRHIKMKKYIRSICEKGENNNGIVKIHKNSTQNLMK